MAQTILVVADDAVTRKDLCEVLRQSGYHAEEAVDGAQALGLLALRGFDLVITDFLIPRLHGLRLVQLIHQKWPKMPVIFMTGYISVKTAEILLDKRAEIISKPVDATVLLSTVQRLLRPMYRKRRYGDVWHACSNCTAWPTADYLERAIPPATEEFCNECRQKLLASECD
jgi:DNA-binding NtrC family response regulator